MVRIRMAKPSDFRDEVALNEASVQFLSPLGVARLESLHAESALHLVALDGEKLCGFLLAFREGAAYDSENYRWFDLRRGMRFIYVDRVVVARAARGRGIATQLYRRVFQTAARDNVPWVTCEFDIEPPNEVSERLHAKFGFDEVGRQRASYANKVVAMQAAPVPGVDFSEMDWT